MINQIVSQSTAWLPRNTNEVTMERPGHMFLFYKESNFLLDSLSRFAGDALRSGSRTIVIGMGAHLDILTERLKHLDLDIGRLIREEQYKQIDAKETLSEILLYGMPAGNRFREVIEKRVMRRHRGAIGEGSPAIIDEMAGLLWLDGKTEAAMRLIELWQELGRTRHFSLCCVYPIGAAQKMEKPETSLVRAAGA